MGLVGLPDICQGLTRDRGGGTTEETLPNPASPGHAHCGGEGKTAGEGRRGAHRVDLVKGGVSVSSSGAWSG